VSEHWNPEGEVARVREARVRESWPAGATVGLALVAAACLAVGVVLYQVAGPRDSFAEEDAGTQ
jgi:negative regulator of sigma E activity